jgi:hypothetical protein
LKGRIGESKADLPRSGGPEQRFQKKRKAGMAAGPEFTPL